MSSQMRHNKASMRGVFQAIIFSFVGFFAVSTGAQTNTEAQTTTTSWTTLLEPQLKVGEATRHLLEIQASGKHASERQYPIPVDIAERIYQRYIKSFEHPIAEKSGSALDSLE